jgi:hypothetical protein
LSTFFVDERERCEEDSGGRGHRPSYLSGGLEAVLLDSSLLNIVIIAFDDYHSFGPPAADATKDRCYLGT